MESNPSADSRITLRAALIDIGIVTLGVLIAGGLQSVRDSAHDRSLLRETRENIHHEMEVNRDHAADELDRVTATHDHLDRFAASLSTLEKDPQKLQDAIDDIDNPGWFFSANSWEAALSTGALARMSPAEVEAYSNAAEGIRRYTVLQNAALAAQKETVSFLQAHPHPSAAEQAQALEKLFNLASDEQNLVWVCPQMQDGVATALRASAKY